MAMWRCPHCGTPQAETARCWVCRRSTTACGSCRHFRRSVAAQLGYCGLDPRRSALRGSEIRACWEAAPAVLANEPDTARPAGRTSRPVDLDRTPVRKLEFVPVEPSSASAAPARARRSRAATASDATAAPAPAPSGEARWSLWEDLEAL